MSRLLEIPPEASANGAGPSSLLLESRPVVRRPRAPEAMSAWSERIHDDLTRFFETADGGGRFEQDEWERPGGGGGWSRVMTDGDVFEKVGVNRSVVHGALSPALVRQLLLPADAEGEFFATGVSIVCHPHSPRVPIVHQNVRYFSVTGTDGETLAEWFGGGIDLTPTYPEPDDAVHFHRTLSEICAPFGAGVYPRYKKECDEYFVNHHRGGEARGVGGVFFDHLGGADDGMPIDRAQLFTEAIAGAMEPAYGPLVERHRGESWDEREKDLQLFRRGRYVEFNLVHDRGTQFGLETAARVESVLMSLPPLATWLYDPHFEPGSIEARLMEMLTPRDWA